jgi:hypothetical protein
LFQRSDHLRFCVIAPRHSFFPFPSLKSYSALCGKRGAGHQHARHIKNEISNAAHASRNEMRHHEYRGRDPIRHLGRIETETKLTL